MKRYLILFICIILTGLFTQGTPAFGQEEVISIEMINELKKEIHKLREQMKAERKANEKRIKEMQKKLEAVSSQILKKDSLTAETELEAEIERSISETQNLETGSFSCSVGRAVQSFNPDISVILDTYYHNSHYSGTFDTEIDEVFEAMSGLGHECSGDHGHAHVEDGFNLRHMELVLSGEVDPYFKAYAIAAVSESDAEIEEAVIQTTFLPAGFQVQAGKFLSHFGRINQQHSHEWDFVDQPLIFKLALGDHGLQEKGVQVSWLAPTPFHLLAGVEAFQGGNEMLFNHEGGDELPDKDGPRLWAGWLKFSPNLPQKHGMQIGFSGGRGVHQEAHDGNSDNTNDHWLDGHGEFWGADFVYKYDSPHEHGNKDITFQAEYLWRKKDLEVYRHDLNSGLVGRDRIDEQDGYYVQALYGILPRWRTGLRWEQVGITNDSDFPDGTSSSYEDSYRIAGMLDFTPTEFSRIRFQVNQGEYMLDSGEQDVWEVFMQLMISLGTHGAHKF